MLTPGGLVGIVQIWKEFLEEDLLSTIVANRRWRTVEVDVERWENFGQTLEKRWGFWKVKLNAVLDCGHPGSFGNLKKANCASTDPVLIMKRS
jgi:hypothetical protein